MTPTLFFVAWRIDIYGAREWYDGSKVVGHDTTLDYVEAFQFVTMREARAAAENLGSRPVFTSKHLPSHPELWVLREGEDELELLWTFT